MPLSNLYSGKCSYICFFVTILVLLFLQVGCEKDYLVAIRSVDTIEPVVSGTTVFTGGKVISNRELEFVRYGVCYSTAANPTVNDIIVAGTELFISYSDSRYAAEYECEIRLLTTGTRYYIRAFVETRSGLAYGNEIDFIIN